MAWVAKGPANELLTIYFTGPLTVQSIFCFWVAKEPLTNNFIFNLMGFGPLWLYFWDEVAGAVTGVEVLGHRRLLF